MVDRNESDQIVKRLEEIEGLLKHLLAVQLYLGGANQQTIAKHLRTSKTSVVKLVRGIEKRRNSNEKPKQENS